MAIFQPKDSRGYFMLPQAPESARYYVYGNVNDKRGTGPQRQMLLLLLLTTALSAGAASWDGSAKPIKGTYQVYGGELGDTTPPTSKDKKVSLAFTGPFAKELFDQIGPDLKNACGASPTHRERGRGDLSCVRDHDGYLCYLGLNVLTGKSMNGSIC